MSYTSTQPYAQIFESTAWLELTYDTPSSTLSASNLYAFERSVADYFSKVIAPTVDYPLSTEVDVSSVDIRASSATTVLDSIVKYTYIENGVHSIQLDTVLMQRLDVEEFTQLLQNITMTENDSLQYSIRPHEASVALESVLVDNGRTKADQALIAAVSVLTILVVCVSAVLLYITGGWSSCLSKVNNCLFVEEEVDDDEYAIEKRATFQVQSYDDGSERGVQRAATASSSEEEQNPAIGLGLMTPARGHGEDDSYMETPSGVPLGIQSVRKLLPPQTPEVPGGLSHLILKHREAKK